MDGMSCSQPSLIAGERAVHVVSLLVLRDGESSPTSPPEWVELIPAGAFSGRDGRGPYVLNINAVLSAFEKAGVDLPIDYDHQTLTADEKAGPVPAAGWIKELQARDGAVWGRVEWTQRAVELIAAREYRYLSPVFRHDKQGRVLALEGAGLTHYPNLAITPIAHHQGDADMTDLKMIAEALGAAPDADAETLIAHAKSLRDAASRQPDPAEWVPMSQHKAVVAELAALRIQITKDKADAAVRAAMSAGKLAPAMKDWAQAYAEKDPDGFAAWCEAAPVILPQNMSAVAQNAGTDDILTEEDRIACVLLGLSETEFAAHKKRISKE